jgi:hypothetical protein
MENGVELYKRVFGHVINPLCDVKLYQEIF